MTSASEMQIMRTENDYIHIPLTVSEFSSVSGFLFGFLSKSLGSDDQYVLSSIFFLQSYSIFSHSLLLALGRELSISYKQRSAHLLALGPFLANDGPCRS